MSARAARLAALPVALFIFVTGNVLALALTHPFEPAAPAGKVGVDVGAGDVYNGETVFQATCAGCHGYGGTGGGGGPALAGRGLDLALVAARIDQGAGVMPPALVTGQARADVIAYVAQITTK